MRCITITNPGSESRLDIIEQDIPICSEEQVLVKVKAVALNRADLLQRQGHYPPPPGESAIPGLEVAGEVIAIGTSVHQVNIGDRVYGLVGSGGYAQYCCVQQQLLHPMPDHWDYSYAAAIPEALTTAHATAFLPGKLTHGQTLLIHAAGSGISTFAIQMARFIGANVISTASTEHKITQAITLGASRVINYKVHDFAEQIALNSIDVIVDFIGGSYFSKHLHLLKPQGQLIQIATMQGRHVDCDLALLMQKRLHIQGFVLRPQSLAEKAALWASAHQQWSHALLTNQIVPVIDSIFPFDAIEDAHQRMVNGEHFGKIVITID